MTTEPAFPIPDCSAYQFGGLSKREWLASHAPIDFQMACKVWGDEPALLIDSARRSFLAVWAMLRYEYADAMLAEELRGGAL